MFCCSQYWIERPKHSGSGPPALWSRLRKNQSTQQDRLPTHDQWLTTPPITLSAGGSWSRSTTSGVGAGRGRQIECSAYCQQKDEH